MGGDNEMYKPASNCIKLLHRDNWESWKINIQLLLKEFDLWGFTDGTGNRAPLTSATTIEQKQKWNKRHTSHGQF